MEKESEILDQEQKQVKVRFRYNTTDTLFASQFLVNTSREELILNLSYGYMADPGTDEQLLPIHTRIAMTPQGASPTGKYTGGCLEKNAGLGCKQMQKMRIRRTPTDQAPRE